jgi:hypothetical protein
MRKKAPFCFKEWGFLFAVSSVICLLSIVDVTLHQFFVNSYFYFILQG